MERGQIANAMEVGLQGKRGTCPRHPCRVGGEVIPLTQLGTSSANQATEDVQQCSPPLTWQRTGIDTFKGFENHRIIGIDGGRDRLACMRALSEVRSLVDCAVKGNQQSVAMPEPAASKLIGWTVATSTNGPRLPSWAMRQVGSCLRYTDRDAFYLGGAALIVSCGKGPDSMP